MEILSFFKTKEQKQKIIIDSTLSSIVRTRKHLELHTKISSLFGSSSVINTGLDDIEANDSIIFQNT